MYFFSTYYLYSGHINFSDVYNFFCLFVVCLSKLYVFDNLINMQTLLLLECLDLVGNSAIRKQKMDKSSPIQFPINIRQNNDERSKQNPCNPTV